MSLLTELRQYVRLNRWECLAADYMPLYSDPTLAQMPGDQQVRMLERYVLIVSH